MAEVLILGAAVPLSSNSHDIAAISEISQIAAGENTLLGKKFNYGTPIEDR